jgi:hypothetical protein
MPFFFLKAAVVVVAVEVLVTDAQNQAILPVIVLNQIHVVIPINKAAMMIIR